MMQDKNVALPYMSSTDGTAPSFFIPVEEHDLAFVAKAPITLIVFSLAQRVG
jgi:hypothetical protein